MNNTCMILLAHGSKNPQWAAPFRKLTADLRADLGDEAVYLCFMENTAPNLMEVAREIMQTGVRKYRLLPMFMAKGAHFYEDIPAEMAKVKAAFPDMEGELLEPIGLNPLFFELMGKVIKSL
ncbi:MAG: CbiX/SirB N-terminal domain-containing protein [Verrucomicrobia bacterium]|nr:CbiX/SirB N-terminal domain-containing protein [Verrucomicrobiota bacterium]